MVYIHSILRFISGVFILGGVFFFVCATVGVIRMPDSYNRGHTAGKGDSPGFLLSLIGIWLYWLTINPIESIKIIVILIFMLLANPLAIHVILRFCYKTKNPWIENTTFNLLKDNCMDKDKEV
ncbi:monovalent cation/H(+) antiporter subunit G [bacterium]|nr:monovalent cation/H(+) antiporter subunit G [bacterium]